MTNKFKSPIKRFIGIARFSQYVSEPLRSRKPKSIRDYAQNFVDTKRLRAIGGSGGNGCISFLQLWCNEFAGPDGGDGGNGGHVIFQASSDVKDLNRIKTVLRAECGEKGGNRDCNGKNAIHNVVKVPIGTVIKSSSGTIVADLSKEGLMYVAAKGGSGGKGNHFFASDTQQTPKICEYGACGEDVEYTMEIKSIAHVGLIGFPNAGKSTLLRAISRARPKTAPYPFTTLRPHIGMVQYDDYEQIAVADLPGLIPDSHKNRGLGIQFLKHTERCLALLYIIDASSLESWLHLDTLQYELSQFSEHFVKKPQLVVANKIDLPGAEKNVEKIRKYTDFPVIPISAKLGTNVKELLRHVRVIYDKTKISEVDNK